MIKITLTNIIALFFCCNIFAALPSAIDTFDIPKTKAAFLQKYGNNDTSRMIIEYFYFKRHNKKAALYIIGGALAITGGAAAPLKTPTNPSATAGFALLGLALAAVALSFAGLIFSVGLAQHSRKKLTETLDYYKSNGGVPRWLKKKKSWQWFCKQIYPKLKKE